MPKKDTNVEDFIDEIRERYNELMGSERYTWDVQFVPVPIEEEEEEEEPEETESEEEDEGEEFPEDEDEGEEDEDEEGEEDEGEDEGDEEAGYWTYDDLEPLDIKQLREIARDAGYTPGRKGKEDVINMILGEEE